MRTYGKITLSADGKFWGLKTEPHVAIRLKAIFTRIPKTTDTYIFSNQPDVCRDLCWFMDRYPLEISDEHRAIITGQRDAEIAKKRDLDLFLVPGYTPKKYAIKGELRHYQAQAVDIFIKNQSLLIGDVVGLGKTLDAIGAATVPDLLPMCVVMQTHLPPQWKEKIEEFLPDAKTHIIKGTKPYPLPSADIYILKYSCLAGWSSTYQERWFKSVVFDEIQELRREDSEKYRAARTLRDYVEYRLGLSATPVYNYGDEMFNIIEILAPGALGRKEDFLREWCGYGREVRDPVALGMYLREHHLFLRRTREEVGLELPPINKIVHTVGFDQEEVDKIEDLARTLAIKATTGTFIERGQAGRELSLLVRQATGISKAKYVAEYVKMILEGGEPVLLAGWHRGVYEIWAAEFKKYREHKERETGRPHPKLEPVWYTGTETLAQKEKAKQDFISGEADLMIISLRSGAGLDGLQERGKIVVLGELDWSPQVHEQLIGRLRRDGQNDQVTAIYLISDSGSDPPVVELLGLKASQAHGIVDPLKGVETVHADDSIIKLIANRFLDKNGPKIIPFPVQPIGQKDDT